MRCATKNRKLTAPDDGAKEPTEVPFPTSAVGTPPTCHHLGSPSASPKALPKRGRCDGCTAAMTEKGGSKCQHRPTRMSKQKPSLKQNTNLKQNPFLQQKGHLFWQYLPPISVQHFFLSFFFNTAMSRLAHLCEQQALVTAQTASNPNGVNEVFVPSLPRNGHCVGRWRCSSLSTEHCDRHGPGGLCGKRQRKVHERIKCHGNLVANRANQCRLILPLQAQSPCQ